MATCHRTATRERWPVGASRKEALVELRLVGQAGIQVLPANSVQEVLSQQDGIVWIDFDHTDMQGMALLADLIKVNAADLQDCYTRTPVPKLHVYARPPLQRHQRRRPRRRRATALPATEGLPGTQPSGHRARPHP